MVLAMAERVDQHRYARCCIYLLNFFILYGIFTRSEPAVAGHSPLSDGIVACALTGGKQFRHGEGLG